MIEAGFPASNPKEQELFELLAGERLEHAEIVAFGMTRRRDVAAEQDEGLRVLAELLRAGLHARRQGLGAARGEGRARLARGEPRDDRRVGRLPRRAPASACCSTPSTSSTASRSTPATRSTACARPPRPGAERLVLCDTNGGSLPPQIRTAFAVVREALPGCGARDPHPRRLRLRASPTRSTAVEAGATQVQGTINGIGERTGNANLVTIIADLQLKMGCELLAPERLARLTETAHFVDELLNRSPDPAQPYVGKHAFAHKAGLHAAGVRADAQTFEHVDPALVGNGRDVLISELSGRGDDRREGHGRPASTPTSEFAQRVARARQGARAPGLPVRGRRRLVRAADAHARRASTSRCSAWSPGA